MRVMARSGEVIWPNVGDPILLVDLKPAPQDVQFRSPPDKVPSLRGFLNPAVEAEEQEYIAADDALVVEMALRGAGLAKHSTPFMPVGSFFPMLVVLDEVLGSQFQAVGAAGHQGRVVRVDRGHALGPAEWMFARGVVDYGIVFVRHTITLRSLVYQGRLAEAFQGVVEPAPWVAEWELPVLGGCPGYCCWPLLRAAPLLPAPVVVPLGLLPAGRPPA